MWYFEGFVVFEKNAFEVQYQVRRKRAEALQET